MAILSVVEFAVDGVTTSYVWHRLSVSKYGYPSNPIRSACLGSRGNSSGPGSSGSNGDFVNDESPVALSLVGSHPLSSPSVTSALASPANGDPTVTKLGGRIFTIPAASEVSRWYYSNGSWSGSDYTWIHLFGQSVMTVGDLHCTLHERIISLLSLSTYLCSQLICFFLPPLFSK